MNCLSGPVIMFDAGRWENGGVLFVGQQCVCKVSTFDLVFRQMFMSSHWCFFFPQLFLLHPIRQAAGHADGSRRCRQWNALVRWPAVHGVLGLHCQGQTLKRCNEAMTVNEAYQADAELRVTEDVCLLHRSGSVLLIASPVTRDPSLSYWLSWNMMPGWVMRLTVSVYSLYLIVSSL